jgi:hypothetical protein
MEELEPTSGEQNSRWETYRAEMIRARLASGHPDPWDGDPPRKRIYELGERRFDGKLTPEEEDELKEFARFYPEIVQRTVNLATQRKADKQKQRDYARSLGYDSGSDD